MQVVRLIKSKSHRVDEYPFRCYPAWAEIGVSIYESIWYIGSIAEEIEDRIERKLSPYSHRQTDEFLATEKFWKENYEVRDRRDAGGC